MVQQREKSWFASSQKSKLQYLGPNPGLPSLDEQPPKEIFLDKLEGPVDAFCLLVLDPDQVIGFLLSTFHSTPLLLSNVLMFWGLVHRLIT